jgi:ribonuclease HII
LYDFIVKKNQWKFERRARNKGFALIAGVDEAGRGPLAGPVVSAAVVLPDAFGIDGVDDSKKLTPKKRSELFPRIQDAALAVGVGIVDAETIDRINILQASLRSMAMAVEDLGLSPDFLLIDGTFEIPLSLPQKALPKGDSLSVSIAAASIIAKVTRDHMMVEFDKIYPQYGFAKHKGYPTRAHKQAVRNFGCSPIHRKSFKGVKETLV